MALPYIGDRNYTAYSNQLYSTGIEPSLLTVNTKIPEDMYTTFATGRFAQRRFFRGRIYNDDSTPLLSGFVNSEDEAQKNIAVYGNQVYTTPINMLRNTGLNYTPYQNDYGYMQLGLSVNELLGLGTGYQFFRGVSNWKYNRVAVSPVIRGVYKIDGDANTRKACTRFNEQIAYAKDFLNGTVTISPAVQFGGSTYNLIGYELHALNIYRVYGENLQIANIIDTSAGEWGHSSGFDYTLGITTMLIGGDWSFNPGGGNAWSCQSFAVGAEKFEGIDLVTDHALVSELNTYYVYYWDKEILDSRIFTEQDLVRFALSLGLPVISSASAAEYTKSHSIEETLEISAYADDVYYPIIKNGKIDGENYLRGAEIKNSPLYKMGKEQDTKQFTDEDMPNVKDETGHWNPEDIDTNDYVEEIPLNTPTVTPVGIFSRWYALTEYDVLDLYNFIYTNDDNQIARIIAGLKLNGENPMNFIISLRMYPFALNDFIDLESEQEIGFGNGVNTGVIAERIKTASFTLDLGKVKFPAYNKNFLDYAPYTNAKLYIPYCGEVSLDTSVYVGHEVSIRMIVDLTSGLCCAVIYRDGIPALYKDGHMAMDIQLTGTNATEFVASYSNALGNLLSGAVEVGVGTHMIANSSRVTGMQLNNTSPYDVRTKQYTRAGANEWIKERAGDSTSGVLREFGGVGKMIEGAYEWRNTPTPLQLSGQSAPLLDLFKPQFAYLIIETAKVISTNNYGNSYGYACLEYGKISALADGALVAAKNVNITPPNATLPEISEIKELLESGVWK